MQGGTGEASFPRSSFDGKKEDQDPQGSGDETEENDEAKGGKVHGEMGSRGYFFLDSGDEEVGDEHPDDGAGGVQGSMETKGLSLGMLGSRFSNHSVAGSCPDTLSKTVCKSSRKNCLPAVSKVEKDFPQK